MKLKAFPLDEAGFSATTSKQIIRISSDNLQRNQLLDFEL